MQKKVLVTAIVLSMISTLSWADEAELTRRIDKLEKTLKGQGQGLVSLSARVAQLQNEVQRLNGDNESLGHELEVMQQQQRERYLDLDKRIQAQASVATGSVVSAAAVNEENSTTQGAGAAAVTEIVDNGEVAYQAAMQTLRSGEYEQAITALEAFPETYPQSSYLAKVYYWQGEANYVLEEFDLAMIAFQTVIDQYPKSSKVADASLKKGFSQDELEQFEAAQATLNSVVENYPNTSTARLAKVRLDRIKQNNR